MEKMIGVREEEVVEEIGQREERQEKVKGVMKGKAVGGRNRRKEVMEKWTIVMDGESIREVDGNNGTKGERGMTRLREYWK